MSLPITKLPKFEIHHTKCSIPDMTTLENSLPFISPEEDENDYQPFKITCIQNYNPIYKLWFHLDETNYSDVALNNTNRLVDMNTIMKTTNDAHCPQSVFIKYAPLLDPIRYMVGKYEPNKELIRNLPSLENHNVHPKILDTNNMAYVDSFFSYLSSQLLHTHNCLHGIDYYGSFAGIQEKFKQEITDDYDYLSSSQFFNKNKHVLFHISHINGDKNNYLNYGSRANKAPIKLHNTQKHNITAITLEDIQPSSNEQTEQTDTNALINSDIETDPNLIYTNDCVIKKRSCSTNNSTDSTNESSNSEITTDTESASDEESEWETEEDSIHDSDDNVSNNSENKDFAYIKDFPVHCIALQKCDGTLDTLFDKNTMGKEEGIAALMQVIMTLLCYQTAFQFTHNDLHTNNIMYVNTTDEFLYYTYQRKVYKVPTYGKIFKIIDFGRAIYNYNGLRFCSDSFAPSGDAHTQYNCEPYMDENKPRLDPNFSFDLCRLGCSLYDFVIDDDNNQKNYDELQQLVYEWCLDDNKKNILYKQNGEERYPNFKLYKMIARTVHKQRPADQLSRKIFKNYIVSSPNDIPSHVHINIDTLPEYYTKYM